MIEEKTLAYVVDMSEPDCKELLRRINYAHLGVALENEPYVVPIHFAYSDTHIYFFTTEGKKTEIIHQNPIVCLQLEDVKDAKQWQSVIVTGRAELLADGDERSEAMKQIKSKNPTLTPAWSVRWMDQWVRTNVDAVYRITPTMITGRTTTK